MRNYTIDLIWTKIQIAFTAIGGWLGYFLGGMDGLLIALIVMMTIDYITGIMCAIVDKKLSSAIGFKGIAKKGVILMLVGVANIIDVHVVGTGSALRGATVAQFVTELYICHPLRAMGSWKTVRCHRTALSLSRHVLARHPFARVCTVGC